MKLHTRAVHAGDRKKPPNAIPSTTPIFTASSYAHENMDALDQAFEQGAAGYFYQRYGNPTAHGLEEQIAALENGAGCVSTSSGMSAVRLAIDAALTDRRRSIVAANEIYGVTTKLLMSVYEPAGTEVRFVNSCDVEAVRKAVADARPGCLIVETISNPLLRVPAIDHLAAIAKEAGAALVVDSTFATPMLVRPLELGAALVAHSLTKYFAGHGDVIAGAVVSDEEHLAVLRTLAATCGPQLGPFECYLSMRGTKTLPLRMERQCANACKVASWLAAHPRVARVYFPADPNHPDAATVKRLFPEGMYGAIVSFDLKDAGREETFRFMDRLRMFVRGTSLGDVHSLASHPGMSSHRDLAPKQRERLGIGDGLVRLSIGIEAVEDIIADLDQALDG
jgi:cystathionine gamma-synthase/methionine-gamma-lyase